MSRRELKFSSNVPQEIIDQLNSETSEESEIGLDEEAMKSENYKIRISIMLDRDILETLKLKANQSGAKYQTLINKILREHLSNENKESFVKFSDLEKMVKEIVSKELKKVG